MHFIIQGVKIIDPTSPFNKLVKDIRIEQGLITEIGDSITATGNQKVYNFSGKCISPGWIDMLTAFGDPGHEYKETIQTGIQAALAGGFTSVCLMPNTEPALHSKSEIEYVINKANAELANIYPYGAVTKNREGKELTEIYDMHHAGAIAFTDADYAIRDAGILLRSLLYVKPFNGVIINIPSDHKIVGNANVNEGNMSVQLGMYGIPEVLEELMVIRDIKLAEYTNSKIHIGIISSATSLPHIREAKNKGIQITAGVSAYQFYFDENELHDYNTHYKVNPPLRTKQDIELLKQAVADGTIDVICSFHLPHENDVKDVEFEYAVFAICGIYRCISPYTSILFTSSFLYAFNPQLKSCNSIPVICAVVQLKNLEGIVFEIGSCLLFFHPLTRSYFSSAIILYKPGISSGLSCISASIVITTSPSASANPSFNAADFP